MISTTSEYFSESMSRSGSEGYWSWDPESFTVVLSRKNSLQDVMDKMNVSHITPALQSPTVSMSRCSTIKANPQRSSVQSQPTHIITPIYGSPDVQALTTPKSHYRIGDTSFFANSCGDSDNFISNRTTPDTTVPLGLGIFGLTNKDESPFGGTGIVGLSRNVFRNNDKRKSAKSNRNRHVSFALIDEVSLTFSSLSSSPLRNPALQRVLSTCSSNHILAARTPTPYPHEFMEAAGGEYFPTQNVGPSSLKPAFATHTLAARIPTPYPHEPMEATHGEYFPLQSVGLSSLQRVFATRTPTPYPHDFMEADDGEYFPVQSAELCTPLQHPSLRRVFAACSVATPILAARTPTPYPHDSMEAPGGEYFPHKNARLGLGLGIFGLTRHDGESFDGMGIVGLQQQGVSRALIEEVAHTFSSPHSPGP